MNNKIYLVYIINNEEDYKNIFDILYQNLLVHDINVKNYIIVDENKIEDFYNQINNFNLEYIIYTNFKEIIKNIKVIPLNMFNYKDKLNKYYRYYIIHEFIEIFNFNNIFFI